MRDINNSGKDVRNNAKQDNVRKGESKEEEMKFASTVTGSKS